MASLGAKLRKSVLQCGSSPSLFAHHLCTDVGVLGLCPGVMSIFMTRQVGCRDHLSSRVWAGARWASEESSIVVLCARVCGVLILIVQS